MNVWYNSVLADLLVAMLLKEPVAVAHSLLSDRNYDHHTHLSKNYKSKQKVELLNMLTTTGEVKSVGQITY